MRFWRSWRCAWGMRRSGRNGRAKVFFGGTRRSSTKARDLVCGQRIDQDIALSGRTYGEETAVGRDGEIAKGEAVQDGARRGLSERDIFAGGRCNERRKIDPDEVAGFFFRGAPQQDAVLVRAPLICAEADAHAGDAVGRGEIA